MNLHLNHDDKFLDFFIEVADAANVSQDTYIVYSPLDKLKYTKSNKVKFAPYNSPKFWELIGDIAQYDRIFIHYLSLEMVDFVLNLTTNAKIIWCFWGAEVLDSMRHFKLRFFQEKTLNLYQKQHNNGSVLSLNPLKIARYYRSLYIAAKNEKKRISAFQKIHYFAHYIPQDLTLIKQYYPSLKATFLPFHYLAVERLVDENMRVNGENILLGNSASFANNHLEAFDLLAKFDLGKRKVITPLSYGNEKYKEAILPIGKELLGDSFEPLTGFLPLAEYNQILQTVSIALMNLERSQAAGNIAALMWSGVKVFMPKESTLFQLLAQHNAHIFDIATFEPSNPTVFEALTEEQRQQNKQALREIFGKEQQIGFFQKMLTV